MKRALILAMALLAIPPARGQDNPDLERRTLVGIRGVRLFVGVAKVLQDAGLAPDFLKTDAELKLRGAGIRILESDLELLRAPGNPSLDIVIEGASIENRVYGYHAEISLSQSIILERNPSLKPTGKLAGAPFLADTWEFSMVGVSGGNPSDLLRQTAKDLVDRFVNAYLSVNSKEK